MSSGMVPIRMIRDLSVSSDEVMVYLAASVRGGAKFDLEALARDARLDLRDAQRAVLSLLESGDIEVSGGCLRLGPLGGGSR